MNKISQTKTLLELLDQALDENRPSPERRLEYEVRLSRLMWIELAAYRKITREVASFRLTSDQVMAARQVLRDGKSS